MTFDSLSQIKTLRRYQWMFRTAVWGGLAGALLMLGSVVAWMVGPAPIVLPWGLLMVAVSAALGLKVAQSTARIIGNIERSEWSC